PPRPLCRPRVKGRQARRAPRAAADQVRVRDQPQDSEGPRRHALRQSACSCRRGDRVRRRDVLSFLGVAVSSYPFASGAQQPERIRQIGMLMGLSATDRGAQAEVAVFRQRLSALGWSEGRNIHLEFRWAGADTALARTFAKELMAI